MFSLGVSSALLWLIAAVVLFIIEGVTTQLVCIWFAFGALVAIIPAALKADLWVQLLIFLIFSIVFLFVARPIVKDRLLHDKQPTNADMVIGQTALVTQEIDNLKQTGRVSVMGLDWSARSENGGILPENTQVRVIRIDGVKLIVSSVTEEEGSL